MRKLKKYTSSDVYSSTYVLKKFNDNYYKLSYFKSLRKKGFVSIQNKKIKDFRVKLKLMSSGMLYLTYGDCHFKSKNLKLKFETLSNKYFIRFYSNLSRARNKIFEYSLCNEFEYFLTLTIDKNKYDRNDLKTYYKAFSQFIRDYRKRYNIDIQYLFIPEQHKNGSWHMHGLIKGIPYNHFIVNSNGYLDWLPYKNKFGFISLSPIKNSEACSVYMTKYITKDLFKKTRLNKNSKLYYCSRNLKTSVEIYRGNIEDINILKNFKLNYENEYIKIYSIRLDECI